MKTIIWGFLIGIFLSFHTAWAQSQVTIDSLQNILDNTKGKGKERIAVLNGLAKEYVAFNKFDKSLTYVEEALDLAKTQEDGMGQADSYYLKGLALFQKNEYAPSLKNLLQALAIYEKIGNNRGKAVSLNQIGQVYKLREEYKLSLDKLKRALDIFKKIEDKEGEATALGQMADVYFRLKRYDEALKFAESSLNLAQEANPNSSTNETARESCKILSEAHFHLKNFEEAYNYQNIYVEIKDAIDKYQRDLAIDLNVKKYERESQEREKKHKEVLRKQQDKQDKEFRDTIQYSLIVFIFILLFGGIFFVAKFDLPQSWIDTMIFLSVLLLSRFFIVMIMPLATSYGADAPLVTLGANFMLALFFAPLQKFLERRLKKKIAEDIAEENEKDRLRAQVKELSEQIESNKIEQEHQKIEQEQNKVTEVLQKN